MSDSDLSDKNWEEPWILIRACNKSEDWSEISENTI